MAIPSNGVTPFISHPCWVSDETLLHRKIENTWAKLHPQERMFEPVKNVSRQTRPADMTSVLQSPTASQHVMKHYDIVTDEYHSYHVEIPEAADNVIRKDCSLKEAHPLAKIEEIQHTALCSLQDIWMLLQVWRLQVEVAV